MAHLGEVEMKLSHPEAALPLFKNAISIDPEFELAHLDLGILYVAAGRIDDALRELKIAAKLAPNDVDVHWRLGRLYRAMGNKEDAKAEIDKAKSITQAADTALVDKMNPHPAPEQTPPAVPGEK
jgi:tetratricopeptide (TPR) repeat protein